MSSLKHIAPHCLLLLLLLIPMSVASAQSNEPKFEVGAQFSALGTGGSTSAGGGLRLTYNLMKYLALEGEMNLYPRRYFASSRYQGQYGIKTGMRYERFGVFGKVRPGFVNDGSRNNFSMDLGGVLEFYPARRWIVRFDIGDTLVYRRSSYLIPIISSNPAYAIGIISGTTHNLQMGAGIGFRF